MEGAGPSVPATLFDVSPVLIADNVAEIGPAAVGGEGSNFLAGHLAGGIDGAGHAVQPPVLIGIQLAVPVQILKA